MGYTSAWIRPSACQLTTQDKYKEAVSPPPTPELGYHSTSHRLSESPKIADLKHFLDVNSCFKVVVTYDLASPLVTLYISFNPVNLHSRLTAVLSANSSGVFWRALGPEWPPDGGGGTDRQLERLSQISELTLSMIPWCIGRGYV